MDIVLRKGELRLIIKPADAPADSSRLIPAAVLQRMFSTVLGALEAASAELNSRKYRSEFFISHLALGSNEIGVIEQPRSTSGAMAVDLVRQVASSIYRSEYERVAEYEKVANKVISIGKAVNIQFPAVAHFDTDSIPLDDFFVRQTTRLRAAVSGAALGKYFVGSALTALDGTLGSIDYRGATWKGYLVLPGSAGAQVECVFDRTKGEDAFNPYGNKRVSVRGRAIYTGDSLLPERIEISHVEEIAPAIEAIDIRGSLSGKHYFDEGDGEGETLQ